MTTPTRAYTYVVERGDLMRMGKARNGCTCYICRERIEVGEKIISKSGSEGNVKYRHLECARRVLLI